MADIRLARPALIMRSAGILRRYFELAARYGTTSSKEGMWLCGGLADVLHNLPPLLIHFDEAEEQRLNRESEHYCERLVVPWRGIFAEVFGMQALPGGLQSNENLQSVKLRLPPLPRLERYLSAIKHSLVCMRNRWVNEWYLLWREDIWRDDGSIFPLNLTADDVPWTAADAEEALFWGMLASSVIPLVDLMTQWDPSAEAGIVQALKQMDNGLLAGRVPNAHMILRLIMDVFSR